MKYVWVVVWSLLLVFWGSELCWCLSTGNWSLSAFSLMFLIFSATRVVDSVNDLG